MSAWISEGQKFPGKLIVTSTNSTSANRNFLQMVSAGASEVGCVEAAVSEAESLFACAFGPDKLLPGEKAYEERPDCYGEAIEDQESVQEVVGVHDKVRSDVERMKGLKDNLKGFEWNRELSVMATQILDMCPVSRSEKLGDLEEGILRYRFAFYDFQISLITAQPSGALSSKSTVQKEIRSGPRPPSSHG